jgi:hypothetical protein
MAHVTLTMEEYQALVNSSSVPPRVRVSKPAKKAGVPNPKLSKALKSANARAKKKNGDFKKGWNQSRVMSTAHASLKRAKK